MWVMTKRYRVSLKDDKNVLKLDSGVGYCVNILTSVNILKTTELYSLEG